MQFLILWIIHKNVINGEWALINSPDRGLIMLRNIKFLNVLPCWVSTVCPLYFYSSRHPCFIRFWILLDQCLQIMKFLSKLLVFIVYWTIEFSFYIIITVIWFPFMQIWTNSCRSVQVWQWIKKIIVKARIISLKPFIFFSQQEESYPSQTFTSLC